MSSCKYKAICLSNDHKKLVKDSSTYFIFKINDFIKSESVLFISKNVKSAVK